MHSRRMVAGLLVVFLSTLAHAQKPNSNARPKRVDIGDGVSLHYVERGRGEPIIFVHGFGGDFSVWIPQLNAFAAEGYRAISYSRRHNFPNRNKIHPNYSAISEADELAAFIRVMKLEKPHVVGHSYGAYTALFLALRHPKSVRTITLAEAPIAPWLEQVSGDQAEEARSRLNTLMEKGIRPARLALDAGKEEDAIRSMIDAIMHQGSFARLPAFVKARMVRNVQELKALVGSKNRYPDVDREQVRQLAVPTLMLVGGKSDATSKWTDPQLARLIPKRSLKHVVLPDASHIMWVEQPVACREAVLQFIANK